MVWEPAARLELLERHGPGGRRPDGAPAAPGRRARRDRPVAYDPAGDRWTVLPAPPAEVRQAAAQASMIWTGRDVLVAAPRVVKVAGKDRTATVAGRYDPDRARWTLIARLRLRQVGELELARAGEVVVEPFGGTVSDSAGAPLGAPPARPDRVGTPPSGTGSLERACSGRSGAPRGPSRSTCSSPPGPRAGQPPRPNRRSRR